MSIRRVFVIWTNPLFHESVRLLLAHPEVEWVGEASDYAAAQRHIAGLHPDTVLIEAINDNLGQVMEILTSTPGNVQIITLSLTNNELGLYQHQHQVVAKAEDLLTILLSGGCP
jgi:AmiR/NasT family two-component response regulator